MSRTLRMILGVTAVSAVFAGCAPGDGDAADPSETPVSAIDEFLGLSNGDDWQEQEARIQESVRVCMLENGFEYIPVDYSDEMVSGPTEYSSEDQLADIKENGFWITTQFGREMEEPGPDSTSDEWVDPNQEITEAMSEEELAAYQEALWGNGTDGYETVTEVDPETGEEYEYQTGYGSGCYGEAQEAEYGDQQMGQEQMWEDLSPLYEDLYAQVEADPRIVEMQAGWAKCMTDRGYDFANQNEMYEFVYEDFQARLTEIVGEENVMGKDPMADWTQEEIDEFMETATDEDWNELYAPPDPATLDYDRDALAALQKEEIDMAVADFECNDGYWDKYQEIYVEIEKKFLEDHLAEFEAIKNASKEEADA